MLEGEHRGVGISVEGEQRQHLEALREALSACAAGGERLAVEVRGYASSAPFNERTAGGLTRAQNSDERNLNVANQRAAAAADVLRAGDSNLEVTEVVWESFGEMTAAPFQGPRRGGLAE